MKAKEKALTIATQLAAKKGIDIEIFDLAEISSFTDFFVICSGTSSRHVKALADETLETARRHGERPLGTEGNPPGRWVLVDLGDVVVHLFEPEAREFYALERLWGDAEQVPVPTPDEAPLAEAQ